MAKTRNRIQIRVQVGSAYPNNVHDIKRYDRLRKISAE